MVAGSSQESRQLKGEVELLRGIFLGHHLSLRLTISTFVRISDR